MAAKPKEFTSSVVNYIPKIKPPEGHSIHHITYVARMIAQILAQC